ncbi:MAG: M56 family metallopeptidase [Eubacteriales bacterium]|uniref:M56 family metallopeptidase n=1 Tax=Fenollaria sp. TaxID=1965292 RepID=UPI002A7632C8|nr:M56 family metallopeptidase [Fenollaria sp.]MDD7339603.1 M56 family metallopeptidase [Eubacteriales bacterium]MDY3106611.1 M56 family metallopeptidase [Fenollaria sp.]
MNIIKITGAYRGIKSILLIAIILLFRNVLNRSSIKRANKVLWAILLIFLLIPYSIVLEVSKTADYGLLNIPIKVLLSISDFTRQLTNSVADVLSRLNIYIIATLFVIYLIAKIVERNKALQGSKLLADNAFANELVGGFHLKRKVTVLLNDNLSTPVTYGVFKPKIVLQSYILEDEELLEHVLVHELTHIKYFDIAFTHIKNVALCLYWYNIAMWTASKLFEDDIEIFCDKKVLERLGNTQENKKAYAMSMFKIMEREVNKQNYVLNFSPIKERILIMKNYKKKFSGICIFIMTVVLSTAVFAEARPDDITEVKVIEDEQNYEGIETERVKIITNEEYEKLNLGELKQTKLRSVNLDNLEELDGLDHKLYKFNMMSFTGRDHDGFTVKISDMKCIGGVKYNLTIKENKKNIYDQRFKGDVQLEKKADELNNYEVIIVNLSTDSLKYKIKLNSYVKMLDDIIIYSERR